MKFAIPILNGEITAHFGHCEKFAVVETKDSKIVSEEMVTPPVHQPGVYPRFLADQNVEVIIAGGMGQKAQDLFAYNNIQVYLGVAKGTASELINNYFKDELNTGKNLCDH